MTRTHSRLPRTLFGGRMRTSTAIIGVVFVGVLLLWYAVRPDPEYTEEVVRVRTTTITEKEAAAKEVAEKEAAARRQAVEEERRRAASPTPTATPTPRPTRTPAATKSPRPTPGVVPPLVSPSPAEEVTPTPTSREPGGLFGIRRGGDTEPPANRESPPSDAPGDSAPATAETPE